MAEESKPKWEGKATIDVKNTNEEQVWSMLQDFCNLHKLIPIDTCYKIEGVEGQPGLIRYCALTTKDSSSSEPTINWAKEKLLTIDPIKRCLSYEIVDSNMGFGSYVATMKVFSSEINGDAMIEWGFDCDPVESWTFPDFISYIQSSLQSMAKNIEVAFSR